MASLAFSSMSYQHVFLQCISLSELAMQGSMSQLMCSPLSLANSIISTRLQSSKFIDTPSGILNVVLRQMTHTSDGEFPADKYFISVKIQSKVSRDKVLNFTQANIKESYDS